MDYGDWIQVDSETESTLWQGVRQIKVFERDTHDDDG